MRWFLVTLVAAATTAGDVLQSKGMRHHGEIDEFHPGAIRRVLSRIVRDPRVVGSIVAYAVAFFAFMRLVSVAPVSFAVPATAMSYVFDTILARYLLHERVQWRRWMGALLVAAGIALLSL